MAKILKPYEVPLEDDLARDILNIPVEAAEVPVPRTIGERVRQAIMAVEEANAILAESPLANLVADTVMRRLKKRGTPSIRVQPDGTVVLRVTYDEERQTKSILVTRKTKKSDLPTMDELRKRADAVGVDISHLGRKRRAIHEMVKAAEEAQAEDEDDARPPERLVDEVGEGPPTSDKKPKTIRRKGAGKKAQDKSPDNGPGSAPSDGAPTPSDGAPAPPADDMDVDDLISNFTD